MPPLSDLAIKALKPAKTTYRVADGGGLCIQVDPTGSKLWRFRYRFVGAAKMMSFGAWPEVSLKEARVRHAAARTLLRDNVDPVKERRGTREALRRNTESEFPAVAAEWLEHQKESWAPETYRKAKMVVDTYLVPALRRRSIDTLRTPDVLGILTTIAKRAPNLAHKARQYIGGIVTRAIQRGLRDTGALTLRGALPKFEKGNIPAATTPTEIVPLLKAIDAYSSQITRTALQLAMLTAMRPGVVASATWSEIDLDTGDWAVSADKMKMGKAHSVPLPRQAVALLRKIQPLSHGGKYVFPSPARQKTPHLHRDALSKALRDMGFQGQHATHGFRSMLRTVARERLGVDIDVLEAQLAHEKKGDVNKAYDRTKFVDQRRVVMQTWADYLDTLRDGGGKVVPIKRKPASAGA